MANTGLGMKVLGADVRLIGKIGRDSFGAIVRHILDEYGAGDDLIEAEGEVTSYSVVVAPPGIDRVFLHCPGANDSFCRADISEDVLQDIALFHFGYPTLLKRMYRDGGAELKALLADMKERGIATSLDLTAVDPSSEAGKADWEAILADALPYVDFFVPSFEEICSMLQKEHYEELKVRAGERDLTEILDLERDIRPLAEKCILMGAKAVLLKCGSPGMYLKTSDHMEETGGRLMLDAEAWNNVSRFEKSYRIERVLSAAGAGDTSIAGFLTSVLDGSAPEEALRNAAAAGALCCTAYDSVSGLLPLKEIRSRILAGWEKSW